MPQRKESNLSNTFSPIPSSIKMHICGVALPCYTIFGSIAKLNAYTFLFLSGTNEKVLHTSSSCYCNIKRLSDLWHSTDSWFIRMDNSHLQSDRILSHLFYQKSQILNIPVFTYGVILDANCYVKYTDDNKQRKTAYWLINFKWLTLTWNIVIPVFQTKGNWRRERRNWLLEGPIQKFFSKCPTCLLHPEMVISDVVDIWLCGIIMSTLNWK